MVNGAYTLGRAQKLAERLLKEHSQPEDALRAAFRITWGRHPDANEMTQALSFFQLPPGPDARLPKPRLTDFCHVLLNSNEFLYID